MKSLLDFIFITLFLINSSNLENDVPIGLKDPNKEWYALTRRVRVMIANPKVVDVSKINDYTDLADPSLKGKVCLRNRKSPYNQSLVANQIISNTDLRVLLIEAGPSDNSPVIKVPLGYGMTFYHKKMNWNFYSEIQKNLNNRKSVRLIIFRYLRRFPVF